MWSTNFFQISHLPYKYKQPWFDVEWSDISQSFPNKQCGLDPIPTWLLKKLSPFMVRLFNSSLSIGYVPSSFKIAQVRPIKKATLDPHQPSSYRPISNLSVTSKLLERLMLRLLVNYFDCNALLPATQSVYRRHHSTEMAVLKIDSAVLLISAVFLYSSSLICLRHLTPWTMGYF